MTPETLKRKVGLLEAETPSRVLEFLLCTPRAVREYGEARLRRRIGASLGRLPQQAGEPAVLEQAPGGRGMAGNDSSSVRFDHMKKGDLQRTFRRGSPSGCAPLNIGTALRQQPVPRATGGTSDDCTPH